MVDLWQCIISDLTTTLDGFYNNMNKRGSVDGNKLLLIEDTLIADTGKHACPSLMIADDNALMLISSTTDGGYKLKFVKTEADNNETNMYYIKIYDNDDNDKGYIYHVSNKGGSIPT